MSFLLQETGDHLLLDPTGTAPDTAVDSGLLETGDVILLETGDQLLLEATVASDYSLLLDESQGVAVTLRPLTVAASGTANAISNVTQVVVEAVISSTPISNVTQVVVEVLQQSAFGPASLTISVPSLDAVGYSTGGNGSETISVPSLDAVGYSTGGTGSVTISVPSLDGTATETLTAAGGVEISAPAIHGEILVGPAGLTQMGRYVVTDESAPFGLLTQLARNVVTAETGAKPLAQLTQMGRQVLYPIVCESPEPTPPIDIPVHVLERDLRPRWMLERFDIKPRTEEGHGLGNPKGPTTASELPEASQWFLERFDVAIRDEASSDDKGRDPVLPEIPAATSWRLMHFEFEQRVEERA